MTRSYPQNGGSGAVKRTVDAVGVQPTASTIAGLFALQFLHAEQQMPTGHFKRLAVFEPIREASCATCPRDAPPLHGRQPLRMVPRCRPLLRGKQADEWLRRRPVRAGREPLPRGVRPNSPKPKGEPRGQLPCFTNADKASGYALEVLRWAVEKGILSGKGGGVLDPAEKATRAETAEMLKNWHSM